MPPPFPVPNQVPLIHITDVSNLPSILKDGGLTCHAGLAARGIRHTSIAYAEVQKRRAETIVPCGQGGGLHDYVPLFFCVRPPMLLPIKSGRVPGRVQDTIVHLVSSFVGVQQTGARFVFTDGHAIVATTQFFTDPADLDKVDWPLMTRTYWNDTVEDGDRKRRRQAEFLTRGFLPWDAIEAIGVMNPDVAGHVQAALAAEQNGRARPVRVKREWYY